MHCNLVDGLTDKGIAPSPIIPLRGNWAWFLRLVSNGTSPSGDGIGIAPLPIRSPIRLPETEKKIGCLRNVILNKEQSTRASRVSGSFYYFDCIRLV